MYVKIGDVDPMMIGRIQVLVPAVSGILLSSWAMPCVPVAGIQTGFFTIPIPGSGVWIEFEQGDPDYPIWVGGFWGTAAEVPALAITVIVKVTGVPYVTGVCAVLTTIEVETAELIRPVLLTSAVIS